MKKLSLLTALLLTSSVVYANWEYYSFEDGIYDSSPEGFCLEAICEHGCVENIQSDEGACCPEPKQGTTCLKSKFDERGCLLEEKIDCDNCIATPDGLGHCCPEPQKSSEISTDEYDEWGCLITKKECPYGTATKGINIGKCCPAPQGESENCLADEYDSDGCLVKTKKDCGTLYCQEQTDGSGVCVKNMCREKETAVEGGQCCLNKRIYQDSDGKKQCCEKDLITLDGTKVCQTDEEVCRPLHITTEAVETLSPMKVKYKGNNYYEEETFTIYKIYYKGKITPAQNIELDLSIMGLVDTSKDLWEIPETTQKLIIKEVKPNGKTKNIRNYTSFGKFPGQTKFKHSNGKTYTLRKVYKTYGKDSKVILEKGKTYDIDINIRNLCVSCLVDSQCAIDITD